MIKAHQQFHVEEMLDTSSHMASLVATFKHAKPLKMFMSR